MEYKRSSIEALHNFVKYQTVAVVSAESNYVLTVNVGLLITYFVFP